LGPPTDPKLIASLSSQALRVSEGRALPVASIAAPPTGIGVSLRVKPNFFPTARRTLEASAMTSGPMPSPARTAMRWVLLMVC
jgi:hypothetical protein